MENVYELGVLEKAAKYEKDNSYSKTIMRAYDPTRHIKIEDAINLIKSQNNDKLPADALIHSLESKKLHFYEFNGGKYLDRIDIGRIYHEDLDKKKGLQFERYFSANGKNPFESVEYKLRNLEIRNSRNEIVFLQRDAEFPTDWDDNSANIVSQKYFLKPSEEVWRKKLVDKIGSTEEKSLKHLVARVSNFIADEGERLGYFASEDDKEKFRDDLVWLQINRRFAFNSPVQFNAGIFNEYGITGNSNVKFYRDPETGEVKEIREGEYIHPQTHACFIKGPRDDLESILIHVENEGNVFSSGSGIGQNIGVLREAGAELSGGGKASGAISFLKIYDDGAGTIKSGGKSRRAARMTTMRQSHPDIMEFIRSKVKEDKKALTLMKAGYEPGMDGEAYKTVTLQNTNISIRLDDEFFDQLKAGGNIKLRRVKTGEIVKEIPADRMMKEIAFGSWRVGDPGVQYESEIQRMHTCKNSGVQNSTNPCGEYMFLDDTSCNLASLNLLEFSDEKGRFDVGSFKKAVRIATTAQDILNDAASYPIKDIAEISPEFRTVGLGFANLGSLLMRRGLPYDSDGATALAGAITAVMTGGAYETSTELAEKLGTFTHYEFNKKPMLEVMNRHSENLEKILWDQIPEPELKEEAYRTWRNVVEKGKKFGFRNAQTTVIAPTGTISYLMGSQDSTGIEPPLSLFVYKDLAGGGTLTLVNSETENALKNLGYKEGEIKEIVSYVNDEVSHGLKRGTVIGAPHLDPDHYKIFDTSFGNYLGEGSIPIHGHVRMMGAVQPFVSGGISKTNNLPENSSVRDIYDTFILGNELSLKGLTIFRSNSKPVSAVNFGGVNWKESKRGEKIDLPNQRQSFEWELEVGQTPLHIIVSEYPNGTPGQIVFLSYKAGSTLGALLSQSGILASTALKRGVHLDDVTKGWLDHSFEPKGSVSGHPYIKSANSTLDLAAKLLLLEYRGMTEYANDPESVDLKKLRGFKSGALRTYDRQNVDDWNMDKVLGDPEFGGFAEKKRSKENNLTKNIKNNSNNRGVTCYNCGNIMVQTSSNCYECRKCAEKIGGCGV